MTRAVLVTRTGGPEVLELGSVDLPPPGPGQARVRHTVIGTEAAGIVDAVGEGTGLSVGMRVGYAATSPGAYAEARIMPADRLVRLPDDVSDETAAAVLLKGMTAEFLVRRAYAVRSGNTVLLHAAAGGVGLLASQWLRSLGARVIGVVSTEEKAKLARENG